MLDIDNSPQLLHTPILTKNGYSSRFIVLSDIELKASNSTDAWGGGLGFVGISTGRAYFEAKCVIENSNGLCRLGWSSLTSTSVLGKDMDSMGYGSTGKKSYGSIFEDYGVEFGNNDFIGCCIDCDAGTVSFSTNGVIHGEAFSTEEFGPSLELYNLLFPAFCLKNASVVLNFGGTPFMHPPPNGYSGLLELQPPPREAFFAPPVGMLDIDPADRASVDSVDKRGNTKLHARAYDGQYAMVLDLLNQGANVELRNEHGRTPLHAAARMCNYHICILLVTKGLSDLFVQDNDGVAAIDYVENKVLKDMLMASKHSRWHRRRAFLLFLYGYSFRTLASKAAIYHPLIDGTGGQGNSRSLELDPLNCDDLKSCLVADCSIQDSSMEPVFSLGPYARIITLYL